MGTLNRPAGSPTPAKVIAEAIAGCNEYAFDDDGEAYHPFPPVVAEAVLDALAAAGQVVVPASVTRVDVVDQDGVHEFWGDHWEIHIQDEGRTLKLVQQGGYGAAAKALRDVALAKDFAAGAAFSALPTTKEG